MLEVNVGQMDERAGQNLSYSNDPVSLRSTLFYILGFPDGVSSSPTEGI